MPRQFIPAVERASKSACPAAAWLATTALTSRSGCSTRTTTSTATPRSFEMAGSKGFLTAFKQAQPVIPEPYMKIEVICPEDNMGQIIGDLNNRRAKIAGMEARGRIQVVKASIRCRRRSITRPSALGDWRSRRLRA